ncbi:7056_t:CDS:2 [Acaulospora colombiana]|uniref:7056_t:CDS:1 n=1 Tax=Acaulospora colombiana TaxID=27376 RepID=A0ACA9K680_9GLOM|nr:7056_t:CDS:2 [Acaulospora colombiana]
MPQESSTSPCQLHTTVSSSSVTATPDKKNIAEAFNKTLEKITNKINEVSLDMTPAGKQLPQNSCLKISPADSDRSESSGHSGESSGQTSSTSICEDSFEIKLEVLEEKPESDNTAPNSPLNSALDRFAPVALSQRKTISAQQKLMLPDSMRPSSRITSVPEKECVTPKALSRIRCVACIHGNPVAEFKKTVQSGVYSMATRLNEKTLASGNPEEATVLGSLSSVFPGGTETTRPVQPMTAVINRPQQVQFGELSKLAVAHNWPVVKLANKLMILQVSGLALPEDLQDRLSPFKKDDDDEADQDSEINNPVNQAPDATKPGGSSGINLLPSNLFNSPPAEFAGYQGQFNPFRDDHEAKADFLHNELKLAQAQLRATASTSRVHIVPPRPQPGSLQAFDVWNRLNERRNAEIGRPQNLQSSQQQRNLPNAPYFDQGNNPFFVKDF